MITSFKVTYIFSTLVFSVYVAALQSGHTAFSGFLFNFVIQHIKVISYFCSVEIILRAEAVETAQAGDKCDFTGTLIVVPDVGTMSLPGRYMLHH